MKFEDEVNIEKLAEYDNSDGTGRVMKRAFGHIVFDLFKGA